MDDQSPDPMGVLLDAALEVHRSHEPDSDGNCIHPDCRSRRPAGVAEICLAYLTASTVLSLWATQGYVAVTSALEAGAAGDGVFGGRVPASAIGTTAPATAARRGNLTSAPCRSESIARGGHPSWCAGPPYCTVEQGLSHASAPERMGDMVLMLMAADGDGPMISVIDDAGSLILPVDTADELGHAIHELSLKAAA
ncbi:hypothetical protein [Rugosimonospora acidiphila]